MYYYVEDKEFLRRAQSLASEILKDLELELRKNYKINSQCFLVGSGGRNMITQNEDEPIDFDYNLNIISCPDWDKAKEIKENTRTAFNKVMKSKGLDDVDDSTSSLTSKLIYFTNNPNKMFSIDVCIVTKNNAGNWERLIHEKTGFDFYDKYYWNTAPNSKDYQKKADKIKLIPGWWDDVREEYLDIKNRYLTSNDYNHPSFVCYIEAVNNVYNYMKQKHII